MNIGSASKVCAVFGFGPKIGASVARKWASEGYKVAILSRNLEKLVAAQAEIPNSKAFCCDVTKPEAIDQSIESIESDLGPIDVLVWNAGNGVWKTWDTIELDEFDAAMKTNVYGLLRATQKVAPGMIERAKSSTSTSSAILVTGATASLRGKPFTVGFAPQKGAQRMMAQSLARDLGPKGVHVGLFILDGQVGTPGGEDPTKLDPNAIANTYWSVANQDRTAWSFETEVRPAAENW
mmetsp:Transcript_31868/g.46459  ORF Transcript_31868/g.46459 Transcript_31868/m.46459 type:complete len:237 (+) Transcript_31868:154-864(+)